MTKSNRRTIRAFTKAAGTPLFTAAVLGATVLGATLLATATANASKAGYNNCLHYQEPAYGEMQLGEDYDNRDKWCCAKSGGEYVYNYIPGTWNCTGWLQDWAPEDQQGRTAQLPPDAGSVGGTPAPPPPGATAILPPGVNTQGVQ
jgi:hypothetical protein